MIDAFDYDAPQHAAGCCSCSTALGVADRKVLILTDGAQPNVYLSGRNLPPCTCCRTPTSRPITSSGPTWC